MTAEGVADLYALVVCEVAGLIGVGTIQAFQQKRIHFLDFVEVLRHVSTQLELELADLGKPTCVEVEVPTLVAHRTAVHLGQRAETIGGCNTLVVHDEVRCLVVVDVKLEVEQVFQQAEV